MKTIAHLGAFNHDSYGDLLLPHIAEHFLGKDFSLIHIAPEDAAPPWKDACRILSFEKAKDKVWDGILIGGGDILQTVPWRIGSWAQNEMASVAALPGLWLGAGVMASRLSVPLAWNAPGCPWAVDEVSVEFVRHCLKVSEYLSVRDEESTRYLFDFAAGREIRVTPDSALGISQMWPKHPREIDGTYFIFEINGQCSLSQGDAIRKGIERVLSLRRARPVLLSLTPWIMENALYERLAAHFRDCVTIPHPGSVRRAAGLIAHAAGYFGNSLHGFITAVSYGIPAIMIPPYPAHKYQSFLGTIGQKETPEKHFLDSWGQLAGIEKVPVPIRLSEEVTAAYRYHWERIRSVLSSGCASKRGEYERLCTRSPRMAEDLLSWGIDGAYLKKHLCFYQQAAAEQQQRAVEFESAAAKSDQEVRSLRDEIQAIRASEDWYFFTVAGRWVPAWMKRLGVWFGKTMGWGLSHTEVIQRSGFFDGEWYLTKYPDVARAKRDPLEHYLTHGWREGRLPGPYFDGVWYLKEYPEVAGAGVNPLEHYLRDGKKKGYRPFPQGKKLCPLLMGINRLRPGKLRNLALRIYGALGDPFLQNLSDMHCVKYSGFFDREWYLKTYSDVARAGRDPLEHYLTIGGTEGRSPSLRFDGGKYLKDYPDVVASGENPLLHYLRKGKKEGRTFEDMTWDVYGYGRWIALYDTLTDETRGRMRRAAEAFKFRPLLSVLMPVYNPKILWLQEAIESVRSQIYPDWELCIADDASTDPEVRTLLERYIKKDPRIKVVFREKNGHISAASNSALQLAEGKWVALLDHDDLLSECALFRVAEVLQQHPETCLIYSDEDKIDEESRRVEPYFKSDWNYDLFLSHNMISHLGVYQTQLLREIGGLRVGMEGSQDYDLALRCLEVIGGDKIRHIPQVLYHWRIHKASEAARSGGSKPYARLAGEKALNEFLQRRKIGARAKMMKDHGYRVRYDLPAPLPFVSLMILTRNGLPLIQKCVKSILRKTLYSHYEILIIDNGSDDPGTLRYLEHLAHNKKIRVIRDGRPFNYSALNNAAVRAAAGELVCFLNNDIEVISSGWLSELVSLAVQPGVGAVGARLWYLDRTLQHGGVILGLGGIASHSHRGLRRGAPGYLGRAELLQSFSAVTAACLMIRKSLFERMGGFNEYDLPIAYNDVDLCIRIREAGYRNVWTPYAELWHREAATRGNDRSPETQTRFISECDYMKKTWGDLLLKDPAYNPNLTLDSADYRLAWPPRGTVEKQCGSSVPANA